MSYSKVVLLGLVDGLLFTVTCLLNVAKTFDTGQKTTAAVSLSEVACILLMFFQFVSMLVMEYVDVEPAAHGFAAVLLCQHALWALVSVALLRGLHFHGSCCRRPLQVDQ